jgi:hypothetical protein
MAQEEYAELVQPGIGDDVNDHAAASGMNADRQAIRKVPNGADVTPSDRDVGQVCGLDPKQRRQVRRLLLDRAEPHELGVLDDCVEHHESLDGVVQRHGFPQSAVRLADGRA